MLAAYCKRLAGNSADGEDLYQITLEKTCRAAGGEPSMTRAYLFRIARNAWIDRCRKRSVREEPLMDDHAAHLTAHRIEIDADIREAFEVIAERLSVRQAVLLLMIDVFGFTAKETAAQFGDTEGAVKEALKRTRSRLARYALEPEARTTLAKPAPASPSGGKPDAMSREWMELFIRAFRTGDIRQLLASYKQLRHRGIDVAKGGMQGQGDAFYFEFLDPNGHRMRVYSNQIWG